MNLSASRSYQSAAELPDRDDDPPPNPRERLHCRHCGAYISTAHIQEPLDECRVALVICLKCGREDDIS